MRTAYGDISPRTAGYVARQLLRRGLPHIQIEKFGQTQPIPEKSTDTIKFRRYEAFPYAPNELQEGVTPVARRLTKTDYQTTLKQYGDLIELTDKVADTHEDPILNEATEILGEQAAQMLETVRFHVLRAGTNVYYANGSSRSAVNTAVSLGLQRKITRGLKRQNGRKLTKMVSSTPDYGTESLEPAFISLVHPDCESDVRNMSGFISVADYGNRQPMEGELGTVEDVRYLSSTIFEPFLGAGSGTLNGMISDGGANVDVYPIIYLAADAFGVVPFKGKRSVTPTIVNPGSVDKSDPLGQRGYAGWKAYHAAVILNDNWLARAEVGATEDPSP